MRRPCGDERRGTIGPWTVGQVQRGALIGWGMTSIVRRMYDDSRRMEPNTRPDFEQVAEEQRIATDA